MLTPIFFGGAINVPTTEERVEKIMALLEKKSGQTAVDLGAGDGRLLVALAKAGYMAYGYEINPFLVSVARRNIRNTGLEDKAFIYRKNLWFQNLEKFDVVVVYGMRHMMGKLEKKLERELKPETIVISNYFAFPTWRPVKEEDKIYLYIKK